MRGIFTLVAALVAALPRSPVTGKIRRAAAAA
jgi:hypothetical protein